MCGIGISLLPDLYIGRAIFMSNMFTPTGVLLLPGNGTCCDELPYILFAISKFDEIVLCVFLNRSMISWIFIKYFFLCCWKSGNSTK